MIANDGVDFSSQAFDQPVTTASIKAELGRSVSAKMPFEQPAMDAWVAEIHRCGLEMSEQVEKTKCWRKLTPVSLARVKGRVMGYVNESEAAQQRMADWMPFITVTARDSSLGLWSTHFKPCLSKKEVLDAIKLGDENIIGKFIIFLESIDKVYLWLHTKQDTPGKGMPLYTIGKGEPVPLKKLMVGKHRTIQMPDWTVLICEHALSSFVDDCGRYFSWDDVMAITRYRDTNSKFGHSLGSDILREAPSMFGGWTKVIDYDVQQWDRSLPSPVIEAIYATMLHTAHPEVIRNLCWGLCGNGTYVIAGVGCYLLPEGAIMWCSGALKTLSGNSLAHDALLRVLGWHGVICGDDANLNVSPGSVNEDLTVEKVIAEFGRVGLTLKDCEVLDAAKFCKVSANNIVATVDGAAFTRKGVAKYGREEYINVCFPVIIWLMNNVGHDYPEAVLKAAVHEFQKEFQLEASRLSAC